MVLGALFYIFLQETNGESAPDGHLVGGMSCVHDDKNMLFIVQRLEKGLDDALPSLELRDVSNIDVILFAPRPCVQCLEDVNVAGGPVLAAAHFAGQDGLVSHVVDVL